MNEGKKCVINGGIRGGKAGPEAASEPEKGREEKGREGKGREGLSSEQLCSSSIESVMSAAAALL